MERKHIHGRQKSGEIKKGVCHPAAENQTAPGKGKHTP